MPVGSNAVEDGAAMMKRRATFPDTRFSNSLIEEGKEVASAALGNPILWRGPDRPALKSR